jgi:hypothetical protein
MLLQEIEESFDFHLHGHEHRGWAKTSSNHVRIAAGACYEHLLKENGYSIARIFPSEGRGKILFRRYDATGQGWVARNIHNKTDNNGCWNLRLTWLNPEMERKIEKFILEQIEVSLVGIDVPEPGAESAQSPEIEIDVESLPAAGELFSTAPKPDQPPSTPAAHRKRKKGG